MGVVEGVGGGWCGGRMVVGGGIKLYVKHNYMLLQIALWQDAAVDWGRYSR